MFHQGEPRFRAWLAAHAGALPRSPLRLRDAIRRLSEQLAESERAAEALRRALAESESDRAARLELIHRLQSESAERLEAIRLLTADGDELRGYASRLEATLHEREAESAARLEAVQRLEADRQGFLDQVARLEAALAAERGERERWLGVLPVLRVRLPGGTATARRLRALRRVGRGVEPAPPDAPAPPAPSDAFLAWVRFAVPGMLAEPNIAAMDHALAHMPAGRPVLEIGSFCGLSTVVLSHLLEKRAPETPLFSCDEWKFEGQQLGTPLGGSRAVTHDDYRAYVRETFLRATRAFAGERLPFTIECDSDELFRRWLAGEATTDVFGRTVMLGGELGFCYIDGNHSYEFARRDFEHTDRVLAAGGFILFDDSADGSEWEVNRLVHEIASGSRYEMVSKNPNYLFRKR